MKTIRIRIGAGAGYSGDRIPPAVELAEKGDLDYLVFECLAERTIALAQLERSKDARLGFDPLLRDRMEAVLLACAGRGVKIITNMGAANPQAAGQEVIRIARELGLDRLKVAVVQGDDVLPGVQDQDLTLLESGAPLQSLGSAVLSANAYLGAEALVRALRLGADVVITGRVADPALFLAPLIHAFDWSMSDWQKMGQGTVVGHLLECAGQVTGGYFADPGYRDVPDLANLGFPLAEVSADGSAVITKVAGSGGCVTTATCAAQLLYEVENPASYLQPDVVADFSNVTLTQVGPDRVRIGGANGHQRPATLKVTVGYRDGFIGEGQISYVGLGAEARGRLALDVLKQRLESSDKGGKVRGLAVTSTKRSPAVPELPTVNEALGLKDYELIAYFAMFAPAGTPPDIIAKLNQAINAAAQSKDLQEKFAPIGFLVEPGTPEALAQRSKLETVKWAKAIRDAKIEPQ